MENLYHTAFGVYGIIRKDGHLLVVKKTKGPYKNRYDLPGGSQAPEERIEETLYREILEETNLKIDRFQQLGTVNFLFPWDYEKTNMNNHIGVFYLIDSFKGSVLNNTEQFEGQDSLGAVWLPIAKISESNSSPLVLKAKEYIIQEEFIQESWRFDTWEVLDKPVY